MNKQSPSNVGMCEQPTTWRRKMRSYITTIFFTLILAFLVVTPAYANDSATDFVRSKTDEIVRVINTSKDKNARLKKLKTALQSTLDYDLLAQRTLARHWENLNAKQQNDFTEALRDLLETSYVTKLRSEERRVGKECRSQ